MICHLCKKPLGTLWFNSEDRILGCKSPGCKLENVVMPKETWEALQPPAPIQPDPPDPLEDMLEQFKQGLLSGLKASPDLAARDKEIHRLDAEVKTLADEKETLRQRVGALLNDNGVLRAEVGQLKQKNALWVEDYEKMVERFKKADFESNNAYAAYCELRRGIRDLAAKVPQTAEGVKRQGGHPLLRLGNAAREVVRLVESFKDPLHFIAVQDLKQACIDTGAWEAPEP